MSKFANILIFRPNNGGVDCEGSSVRGLICPDNGITASQCSPFTHLTYGNRLCAAFKNDQRSPDRDLDGRSYVRTFVITFYTIELFWNECFEYSYFTKSSGMIELIAETPCFLIIDRFRKRSDVWLVKNYLCV